MFIHESPEKASEDSGDSDFMSCINPDSYCEHTECFAEPSLLDALAEQVFQFEREGYFVADRHDFSSDQPVFNKTIGLRDSWPKQEQS
mgnify:FL=1